ncbi:MAG: ABC transporter permease [Thermaerobacter sp.]|nr:ABC transporter permease [Thermaerobacter sp.]
MTGIWPDIVAHGALIWQDLLQHVEIVFISVAIGCLIAIPMGIWLTRRPRLAEVVITVTGLIQTVPSLALLALVLPVLGVGLVPAVSALALYALLPILRNTYVGVRGVPAGTVECAKAMGMNRMQVLSRVELPLAAPVIVAGVRLSTVYLISWAVLAALIGGGGLGNLILEGLATYDFGLIIAGAVPAALLAIAAGLLLSWLQRALTPVGVRRLAAGERGAA